MLNFLRSFFGVLDKLLSMWHDKGVRDEGRQEVRVQAEQGVKEHVQQAQEAVTVADPVRDERLRDRFDRDAPGAE